LEQGQGAEVLNLFERLAVKAAWKRMEATLPAFKTYAPLIGSAVLAAVVVLRLLGYSQEAEALESVGGVVGITKQSPVGIGELTAAGAVVFGIVRKLRAVNKAA
jgi:hypothetical protein